MCKAELTGLGNRTVRKYLGVAVLMTVMVFVTACGAQTRPAVERQRLNILWIIADDLSPDLSCYGEKAVSTPNLDRLAKEGVMYTRAFSTSSVCSTSRSAFITGVYQTTTGTHHHRTNPKQAPPDGVVPITERFRAAGYFVTNGNSELSGGGKTDYNFRLGKRMYDGHDWRQRPEETPFFSQVQVFQPHRPFHEESRISRRREVTIPPYIPDHPLVRADYSHYLSDVEMLDRQVGDVLKRLEEDGLLDSTVVIFFSDQGRPQVRSKQWLYDGGVRVPLIVRWPDGRDAGTVDDRLVSLIDASASTLTLGGIELPHYLHGIDFLDGERRRYVFAARNRNGNAPARLRSVRDERFKYIRNGMPERAMMPSSYYKLLHYPVQPLMQMMHEKGELTEVQAELFVSPRPVEELYDTQADPHEIVNLAGDPAYAKQLKKMRHELDKWIERTGDRGQVEEEASLEEAAIASSTRWHGSALERRGLRLDSPPEAHVKWWMKHYGVEIED